MFNIKRSPLFVIPAISPVEFETARLVAQTSSSLFIGVMTVLSLLIIESWFIVPTYIFPSQSPVIERTEFDESPFEREKKKMFLVIIL